MSPTLVCNTRNNNQFVLFDQCLLPRLPKIRYPYTCILGERVGQSENSSGAEFLGYLSTASLGFFNRILAIAACPESNPDARGRGNPIQLRLYLVSV